MRKANIAIPDGGAEQTLFWKFRQRNGGKIWQCVHNSMNISRFNLSLCLCHTHTHRGHSTHLNHVRARAHGLQCVMSDDTNDYSLEETNRDSEKSVSSTEEKNITSWSSLNTSKALSRCWRRKKLSKKWRKNKKCTEHISGMNLVIKSLTVVTLWLLPFLCLPSHD